MICGGHSGPKQPTEEVIQLVSDLRSQIESQGYTLNADYEVVSYTSQVVAGTNYTVTIRNGEQTLEVVIYQPLPHTNQPASVTEVRSP